MNIIKNGWWKKLIEEIDEEKGTNDSETIVFDIYADNGKKFCECRKTNSYAVLSFAIKPLPNVVYGTRPFGAKTTLL